MRSLTKLQQARCLEGARLKPRRTECLLSAALAAVCQEIVDIDAGAAEGGFLSQRNPFFLSPAPEERR